LEPLKTYRLASGRSFSSLGDGVSRKALDAFGVALYREADGIIQESQGLVPVDTGALRSSKYTEEPKTEGNMVTVDFGYGGPAAQINPKTGESTEGYALYVHENLDAFHKVGTAKFLEMPFDQAREGMADRVRNNVRAIMHGLDYERSETGGATLEPAEGFGD
jgi:hypothetical protein